MQSVRNAFERWLLIEAIGMYREVQLLLSIRFIVNGAFMSRTRNPHLSCDEHRERLKRARYHPVQSQKGRQLDKKQWEKFPWVFSDIDALLQSDLETLSKRRL
jgi:hypothetical protein